MLRQGEVKKGYCYSFCLAREETKPGNEGTEDARVQRLRHSSSFAWDGVQ